MFYRKEINAVLKHYDNRIIDLENQLKFIKEKIDKPRCYEMTDIISKTSYLYFIRTLIETIIDYLKIDVRWEWQDDPNCVPPEMPKIKVWKAYKRK